MTTNKKAPNEKSTFERYMSRSTAEKKEAISLLADLIDASERLDALELMESMLEKSLQESSGRSKEKPKTS